MRICFVTDEVFHYGAYGGFGKIMRIFADGLKKKGYDVFILSKKPKEAKFNLECIGGIPVFLFSKYVNLKSFLKIINADIYISIEPKAYSFFIELYKKNKKHFIMFIDPRDKKDWKEQATVGISQNIKGKILYNYRSPFNKYVVKRADLLLTTASYISKKVKRMYNLKHEPITIPQPIKVIKNGGTKSKKPVIIFLARLDNYKRPWIALEVAKHFPNIEFHFCGKIDSNLKSMVDKYKKYKNIKIRGLVFGKEKEKLLESSWVLLNTSIHEGLPQSFLEASANKCAILSCRNPDNFSSKFGRYVPYSIHNTYKDFIEPLKWLLENNRWKELGEKAYKYVKKNYETNNSIKKLINLIETY